MSVLAGISSQLENCGPRIPISAGDIAVLEGPAQFYDTLKSSIGKAKKRIFLSTLYVGKTEYELVACIRAALERNPSLQLSILTDALRGTREHPDPSCASLLLPLIKDFPNQVEIRMYHTPNLTGLRKRYVPKRINEGWGLQHMKIYGIDDTVILSGANLSNDYFTNRQDRYHVFKSKVASDYFAKIHHAMAGISFLLVPSAPHTTPWVLTWPQSNPAPSPMEEPDAYNTATTKVFKELITPSHYSLESFSETRSKGFLSSPSSQSTTSIYPILSLPQSINTEIPTLTTLLSYPYPQMSSYFFTAGYFNPHPLVASLLLAASNGNVASSTTNPNTTSSTLSASPFPPPSQQHPLHGTILTAHPHANGFLGSSGVSGLLPGAYTLLARRFLGAARQRCGDYVVLKEWKRGKVSEQEGWTYHAKGLWITLPKDEYNTSASPQTTTSHKETPSVPLALSGAAAGPSITVIGSSNYTLRSNTLDTEVGAVIVTSNEGLQRRLKAEEENLLRYAQDEELWKKDRRVGPVVRIALWIVGLVGGAL
ncbi:CDP-diacylglycerol--glycerol-3-phosphate 3-phosphatidyltransferase [Agyrium rufum]|nr:CDP-diacylglycerol--glycerol-3-phosphate 3-phosphatidyltransferase [Agyrium rufum]